MASRSRATRPDCARGACPSTLARAWTSTMSPRVVVFSAMSCRYALSAVFLLPLYLYRTYASLRPYVVIYRFAKSSGSGRRRRNSNSLCPPPVPMMPCRVSDESLQSPDMLPASLHSARKLESFTPGRRRSMSNATVLRLAFVGSMPTCAQTAGSGSS